MDLGHYTAKAQQAMSSLIKRCHAGGKAELGDALETLWSCAVESPKFFLPDGGRLFDSDYRALPNELRLPYDSVVLEYAHSGINSATIILALQTPAGSGIFTVWYVLLHDEMGWVPGFHYARVFRGADGKVMIEARAFPCVGGAVPEAIANGLADYAHTVLGLVEILACSNVTTQAVPPPEALNRKRIRNGKLPFDTYHVLTIPGANRGGSDAGGSHASPRQHLRRGHIRRLSETRTTWVNAHVVGKAERGRAIKDYAVKAPATPRQSP